MTQGIISGFSKATAVEHFLEIRADPHHCRAHGSWAFLLSVSHPRDTADLGPTTMESFILPTFPQMSQFVSETKGLLGLKVTFLGEWDSKRQGG